MPPAARALVDTTAHPLPPMLSPGPGSPTVLIGFAPAWRGIPLAAVAALQSAKASADAAIQTAVAATAAAAGTPGAPAAVAAEQATKAAALLELQGGPRNEQERRPVQIFICVLFRCRCHRTALVSISQVRRR